jgi:hypothetical protein
MDVYDILGTQCESEFRYRLLGICSVDTSL